MEKISVIVPVYNVEKYIDKCIRTIVNQTYKNLEIILVDDGSKDNSGIICDKWCKIDKRILVIHKKNGGLSDARNVGIEHATGDYIAFIDSDDFIDSDMFELLYKNINETHSQISICKYIQIKENQQYIFKKNNSKLVYERENGIKELLLEKNITNHAWNKLYKKYLFTSIRFPKGRNFEDIGTTYKLFSECDKIVYSPSECYAYIIRGNSITGKVNEKSLLDQVYLVKERYDYINNNFNIDYINVYNRIYFVFRYHMTICKFLNKKVFNSLEIVNEYNFFKNNYKKVKSKIKNQKIFYDLLFFNRSLFYYTIRFLYKIKGIIRK